MDAAANDLLQYLIPAGIDALRDDLCPWNAADRGTSQGTVTSTSSAMVFCGVGLPVVQAPSAYHFQASAQLSNSLGPHAESSIVTGRT